MGKVEVARTGFHLALSTYRESNVRISRIIPLLSCSVPFVCSILLKPITTQEQVRECALAQEVVKITARKVIDQVVASWIPASIP